MSSSAHDVSDLEPERLRHQIAALRAEIAELRETIQAIHQGGVDAVIVGEQIYTLVTADRPYRLILQNMNEGAVTVSEGGAILYANARLGEMLQRDRTELLGKRATDLTTPDDRATLEGLLALRPGERDQAELSLANNGGGPPVAISAGCFEFEGTPIHFLIVTDLTDVRRNDQRLRALFDRSPVGIAAVGLDGRFVDVNLRLGQITGYGQDLVGMTLRQVVHPDDRDEAMTYLSRLDGAVAIEPIEHRCLRRDGSTVWISASGSVAKNAKGDPEHYVIALEDIDDRRRAQQELVSLTVELENRVLERTTEMQRALDGLEAFTYSVAHDLRAPVRTLSSFSEILVNDFGDLLGAEGRAYTERIRSAAEHMAGLIDDLLGFSRLTRAVPTRERLDLSAIARSVDERLRREQPDRSVIFHVDDGITCWADRDLMTTAVENLISNAWKFTSQKATAEISFAVFSSDADQKVIAVRDNGVGFDPRYIDKLFQPFQRVHAPAEFPGNGIGLAGVRLTIERHGGRVWATGDPGGGATFYFALPKKRGGEGVNKSDRSILLVEDNPDDEALTMMALKKANIINPVTVAHDGAEALAILFGHSNGTAPPAIVLLDLRLPKVDGFEVLRQVREAPATRLVPVVVLTSSAEEEDLALSYALGANAYVRKPVTFSEFADAINTVVMFWLLLNEQPPPRATSQPGTSTLGHP